MLYSIDQWQDFRAVLQSKSSNEYELKTTFEASDLQIYLFRGNPFEAENAHSSVAISLLFRVC